MAKSSIPPKRRSTLESVRRLRWFEYLTLSAQSLTNAAKFMELASLNTVIPERSERLARWSRRIADVVPPLEKIRRGKR